MSVTQTIWDRKFTITKQNKYR